MNADAKVSTKALPVLCTGELKMLIYVFTRGTGNFVGGMRNQSYLCYV